MNSFAFKLPRLPERWTKPSLLWLLPIVAAGFIAWYWDQTAPDDRTHLAPDSYEAADTSIPAGFVLVPIEVSNYEALDSLLGKFGVVDLFAPASEPGKRPLKVAERIKILRAPLNPSRFAVLAPEGESSRLVSHPGPFLVIVQNPKHTPRDASANSKERSEEQSLDESHGTRGRNGGVRSRVEVEVSHVD